MDKETSSAQEILSARKKAVFSVKTLVFFVLAVMIIYFLVIIAQKCVKHFLFIKKLLQNI